MSEKNNFLASIHPIKMQKAQQGHRFLLAKEPLARALYHGPKISQGAIQEIYERDLVKILATCRQY